MYEFRIGISTVSLIVRDVCTKISNHLKEMVMPEPNSEKWSEIADGFYKRSDFPNCVGAMDAKRLKVAYNTGKRKDGEKRGFCCSTYVILAICDSNYLFTDFDVVQYNHTDFKGQLRDPDLFANTIIGKKLYNNEMNLPDSRPLPETNGPDMPFVLVADKAFGLSRNVMRPYCVANFQNKKSRVFNYRLSRARRFIECTFAILSNKWEVFHRTVNAAAETADRIVRACIILHNFVLIRDGYCFEDTVQIDGFGDVTNVSPASQMTGLSKFYRNKFANYFLSPEGERKWQYTRI